MKVSKSHAIEISKLTVEFNGIPALINPETPSQPQTVPTPPEPTNLISDIKKNIPL